uniref:Uncharacterized protein n=1 Tax=Anguilla anguilla TaxID=7936 RepID=A0A0E9PYC7_ANGAN
MVMAGSKMPSLSESISLQKTSYFRDGNLQQRNKSHLT